MNRTGPRLIYRCFGVVFALGAFAFAQAGALTVTPTDIAPAQAGQGESNVPMVKMTLSADAGTIQVQSVKVDNTTASSADANINAFKVWENPNDSNTMDGDELFLGSAGFSGNSATVSGLTFDVTAGTPRNLILTYDVASGAPAGSTYNARLPDNTYITVDAGNSVNAFSITSSAFSVVPTLFTSGASFAPAEVIRQEVDVPMYRLKFNTSSGTVTVNQIDVGRIGSGADTDVSIVRLYEDSDCSGAIDGGEPQLGTNQTFSSGKASFTGLTLNVTTSDKCVIIAYTISSTAQIGKTLGSSLPDNSYIAITGGVKASFTNLNSSLTTIVDQTLTVSSTDRTSANPKVFPGQRNVPVLKLTFAVNKGSVTVNSFQLERIGTAPLSDVTVARVYEDANNDGEAGITETKFADVTFLSTTENVSLGAGLTVSAGTNKHLIVIFDYAGGAAVGNTAGVLAKNFSSTFGAGSGTTTLADPLTSGTATLSQYFRLKSVNKAPAQVAKGQAGVVMLQLVLDTLKPAGASTTVDTIKVRRVGGADSDIAAVKLYEDANADGILDGGDPQLGGNQTLSAGVATFSSLGFSVAEGTTRYMLVVFDFSASATPGNQVQAKITGTDITVTPSSTLISNFSTKIAAPGANAGTSTAPAENAGFVSVGDAVILDVDLSTEERATAASVSDAGNSVPTTINTSANLTASHSQGNALSINLPATSTKTTISKTLTVTPTDLMPTNLGVSTEANVVLRLRLVTDGGTTTLDKLKIRNTGTAADTDIAKMIVYEDVNNNQYPFDSSDKFLAAGTFTAGEILYDFNPDLSIDTSSKFLIFVANVADGATLDNQLRLSLDTPDITPYVDSATVVSTADLPFASSATAGILRPTIQALSFADLRPAPAGGACPPNRILPTCGAAAGATDVNMAKMMLDATSNVSVNSLKLELLGSIEPAAVTAKVYRALNCKTNDMAADNSDDSRTANGAALGSATFGVDKKATVPLLPTFDVGPATPGTDKCLLVRFDLSSSAEPGATYGLRIPSGAVGTTAATMVLQENLKMLAANAAAGATSVEVNSLFGLFSVVGESNWNRLTFDINFPAEETLGIGGVNPGPPKTVSFQGSQSLAFPHNANSLSRRRYNPMAFGTANAFPEPLTDTDGDGATSCDRDSGNDGTEDLTGGPPCDHQFFPFDTPLADVGARLTVWGKTLAPASAEQGQPRIPMLQLLYRIYSGGNAIVQDAGGDTTGKNYVDLQTASDADNFVVGREVILSAVTGAADNLSDEERLTINDVCTSGGVSKSTGGACANPGRLTLSANMSKNHHLRRVRELSPSGSVSIQSITIRHGGTGAASDIAHLRIYQDDDGNGQIDAGEPQIIDALSPAFPATLTPPSPLNEVVAGADRFWIVAYDFADEATTGNDHRAQVNSGDVTLTSTIASASFAFTPIVSSATSVVGNKLTVSGSSLAPSFVKPGDTNMQMLALNFSSTYAKSTLTDLTLNFVGDNAADVANVKIWADLNKDTKIVAGQTALLETAAGAGATVICVNTAGVFTGGETIYIGVGKKEQESNTVSGVATPGSCTTEEITLGSALQNAHAAGEEVADGDVPLGSGAFAAGQVTFGGLSYDGVAGELRQMVVTFDIAGGATLNNQVGVKLQQAADMTVAAPDAADNSDPTKFPIQSQLSTITDKDVIYVSSTNTAPLHIRRRTDSLTKYVPFQQLKLESRTAPVAINEIKVRIECIKFSDGSACDVSSASQVIEAIRLVNDSDGDACADGQVYNGSDPAPCVDPTEPTWRVSKSGAEWAVVPGTNNGVAEVTFNFLAANPITAGAKLDIPPVAAEAPANCTGGSPPYCRFLLLELETKPRPSPDTTFGFRLQTRIESSAAITVNNPATQVVDTFPLCDQGAGLVECPQGSFRSVMGGNTASLAVTDLLPTDTTLFAGQEREVLQLDFTANGPKTQANHEDLPNVTIDSLRVLRESAYSSPQDKDVVVNLYLADASGQFSPSSNLKIGSGVLSGSETVITLGSKMLLTPDAPGNQKRAFLSVKVNDEMETVVAQTTATASAGASSLDVDDVSKLKAGDFILIGAGADVFETREISSIAGSTVNIFGTLSNTHPVGTKIVPTRRFGLKVQAPAEVFAARSAATTLSAAASKGNTSISVGSASRLRKQQTILVGNQTPTTTTDLVSSTSTGATIISVLSTAGISVNDRIVVGVGTSNEEYRTVVGIAGGNVTLDPPLLFAHAAGEKVGRARTTAGTLTTADVSAGAAVLPVASESGFAVGDAIVIDPGTASEEFRKVGSVAAGQITLDSALSFAHGAGTPVGSRLELRTITNIVGTTITLDEPLSFDHDSGVTVAKHMGPNTFTMSTAPVSSGLGMALGNQVKITPTSLAPASANRGARVTMASALIELTPVVGSVTVTGINVDLAGTGASASDIAAVNIYRDANGNGTFEDPEKGGADVLIGAGTFSGSLAQITFTTPITLNTTTPSRRLFIVYDIAKNANKNVTVAAKLSRTPRPLTLQDKSDTVTGSNLAFTSAATKLQGVLTVTPTNRAPSFAAPGQASVSMLSLDSKVANHTTLSSAASPGATAISVASETGFSAGDSIIVGLGTPAEETNRVASVSAGTINLKTALTQSHASGATVTRQGFGVTLSCVRVKKNGTVADSNLTANLYEDANANGKVDSGETLLKSATFGASLADHAILSGLGYNIPLGSTKSLLLTADVGAAATDGQTVQFEISVLPDDPSKPACEKNDPLQVTSPDEVANPGYPVTSGTTTVTTTDTLTVSGTDLAPSQSKPAVEFDVLQVTFSAGSGSVTVESLKVEKTGTINDADVESIRLLDDGSNQIGSGTLSSGTLTFSGLNYAVTVGTDRPVTLKAKFKSGAPNGAKFGLRVKDQSFVTVTSPDVVSAANFPIESSQTTVSTAETLNVTGTSLAPASAKQGDKDVPVLKLTVEPASGSIDVTGVKVKKEGTAAASDLAKVSLYEDADNSGTVNTGDTLLASGDFTAADPLSLTGFTVNVTAGTPKHLLIAYDVAATATAGNTAGASLTDNTFITVNSPNVVNAAGFPIVSANFTINESTNMVDVAATDKAPSLVGQTVTNKDFLQLALKTQSGTSSLKELKVKRIGTSSDSDVAAVKLFNGTTQLGSTTFSSGVATFAGLSVPIDSATGATLDIKLDIAATATLDATVGVEVSAAADIVMFSSSDTVNGTFPMQSSLATITPPPKTLTVTSTSVAPPTLTQGSDKKEMLALTLTASADSITVDSIKVTQLGDAADADVSQVYLYLDADADQKVSGTDTILKQGVLSASVVTFTGLSMSVGTAGTNLLVAVGISPDAPSGKTAQLGIEAASDITVAAPDEVSQTGFPHRSGVMTIGRNALTVSGVGTSATQVQRSQTNVIMGTLTLSAGSGNITVTSVQIKQSGTGRDADISQVRLVHDADKSGTINATDPVLGSGTFSSNVVTFSGLTLNVKTGADENLLVAYDIASDATYNNTLEAAWESAAFIQVTSPDSVAATNFPITFGPVTITDVVPPAQITDLAATASATNTGEIDLSWTAVGDDGTGGGAAQSYTIKYHTVAINDSNWASATTVSNPPTPKTPGTKETFTVTGLTPLVTYFFAVKAKDAAGNEGAVSNSPNAVAPDKTPPDIAQLTVNGVSVTGSSDTPLVLVGTNVSVSASISDNLGEISSATLYYRKVGDADFQSAAMSASGSTFAATIPASHVTSKLAEYYIEAVDPSGNTGRLPSVATFEIPTFSALVEPAPSTSKDLIISAAHYKAEKGTASGYVLQGSQVNLSFKRVDAGGTPELYHAPYRIRDGATGEAHVHVNNYLIRSFTVQKARPGEWVLSQDERLALRSGKEATVIILPGEAEPTIASRVKAKDEAAAELIPVSGLYHVGPWDYETEEPVTIRLEAQDEDLRKVGAFRFDEAKGKFEMVERLEHGERHVTSQTRRFGSYRLFRDETAPRLKGEVSDGQKFYTKKPRLSFHVEDHGAGVHKGLIDFTIDGKGVAFDYDEATGELVFEPKESLPGGEHRLLLRVRDRLGNETATQLKFVTPAPVTVEDFFAFPNPSSGRPGKSRFALRLKDPYDAATQVSVELYSTRGRLVGSLCEGSLFTCGKEKQKGHFEGDLTTSMLSNGVYLLRLLADDGDARVQKIFKWVVLR